jgi:hypothetical protein
VSGLQWFRPDHAGWDPRLYEWFFNVPARSAEGRIYALAEFVNRRRIYLYSLSEIVGLGKRMGLRVETATTAGLSRGGITIVVGAMKPSS